MQVANLCKWKIVDAVNDTDCSCFFLHKLDQFLIFIFCHFLAIFMNFMENYAEL